MGATEIDNLHDALVTDDDIVEFEIAVGEAHAVNIRDAIEDLQEAAADLFTAHSASHDNGKQVVRAILHDFEPAALFLQNVERLDDVAVVERGTNAKLRRHLLGVFLLRLVGVAGAELLDGKDGAVLFAAHQADGATGAGTEHLAELAVLGSEAVVVGERHVRRTAARAAWGCLGLLGLGRRGRGFALLVVARLAEESLQVGHGAVGVVVSVAVAMTSRAPVAGIILGGKGAGAGKTGP